MSARRVGLYWICFGVLTAYYVIVLREPAGQAAAHLTRAAFLDVSEDRIDGLELRRGEARLRCRRIAGRWQVVEPAGSTAPPDLVAALVDNLTSLPNVEVVAENGENLAQFGLDPPVSQLVLSARRRRPITVRLGSRNPAGTAVYAQRDDSARVFLIGLSIRYYEDLLFEAVRPRRTT
ncbi:MAG: DUF4340 domain-containing protein [Candidatus Binatia bacterium]